MAGIKCEVCGLAWALKTPDVDGGRRCVAHSLAGHAVRGSTPPSKTPLPMRTKAAIYEALEEARDLARKRKDPSSMINAARAAAMVLQIPDPVEPGAEVGGWAVTIVTAAPPRLPASSPEPYTVADAE